MTRNRRPVAGCARCAPRAHAELLGHAQRALVARLDDRDDQPQAEALEAERDARAGRLGREPPAPPRGGQPPADLDGR
jgi:hypothetical protein